MRVLARAAADRDQLERDHVHASRLLRREIVREAEPTARGLAREGEARALRPLVFVVDDEVVAFGLAWEVTVDDLRHEEPLALGARLQLFVDRAHLLFDQRAVVLRRAATLLELP